MLRKFLFLIIVVVAFQQIHASVRFSASNPICHKEIVGTFHKPAIQESFFQLSDIYWEEDELDRFNWEKKLVKLESNPPQSFSLAIFADRFSNKQTQTLADFFQIPIYLNNSNFRI